MRVGKKRVTPSQKSEFSWSVAQGGLRDAEPGKSYEIKTEEIEVAEKPTRMRGGEPPGTGYPLERGE